MSQLTTKKMIISFLMILPSILELIYIKFFGVNIVYGDQWELVPLIEKLHASTLTFGDLFAQHNEHRILFPKIIMLILADMTQYNTVSEMYFSWILTVIIFMLIFQIYKHNFETSMSTTIKFIPIAWLIFNFRQHENILWGWQISIYLSVLGFISAIYTLNKSKKIDKWFIMAIFCGIISTFSFFNGLFVWPIGILFVILSKRMNRKILAYVWTIVGMLIWGIYLYNWTKPFDHPPLLFAINNFNDGIIYFITNIGSPLAFEIRYAFIMGIILILLTTIAIILIVNNESIIESTTKNAIWITFILFSVASSLALVVGRSGFGAGQALSSRYVTITSLGIIGIYSIIANLTDRNIKIFYGIFLSIILIGIIVGYTEGIKIGDDISRSREYMANNLIYYKSADDADLKQMYPDANIIRKYAEILEIYELNVFSNQLCNNSPHIC